MTQPEAREPLTVLEAYVAAHGEFQGSAQALTQQMKAMYTSPSANPNYQLELVETGNNLTEAFGKLFVVSDDTLLNKKMVSEEMTETWRGDEVFRRVFLANLAHPRTKEKTKPNNSVELKMLVDQAFSESGDQDNRVAMLKESYGLRLNQDLQSCIAIIEKRRTVGSRTGDVMYVAGSMVVGAVIGEVTDGLSRWLRRKLR